MWLQVYDLFDDVLLLANGRILYHGPRGRVQPHFEQLGFALTGTKAEADFLQARLRLVSFFACKDGGKCLRHSTR